MSTAPCYQRRPITGDGFKILFNQGILTYISMGLIEHRFV